MHERTNKEAMHDVTDVKTHGEPYGGTYSVTHVRSAWPQNIQGNAEKNRLAKVATTAI